MICVCSRLTLNNDVILTENIKTKINLHTHTKCIIFASILRDRAVGSSSGSYPPEGGRKFESL